MPLTCRQKPPTCRQKSLKLSTSVRSRRQAVRSHRHAAQVTDESSEVTDKPSEVANKSSEVTDKSPICRQKSPTSRQKSPTSRCSGQQAARSHRHAANMPSDVVDMPHVSRRQAALSRRQSVRSRRQVADTPLEVTDMPLRSHRHAVRCHRKSPTCRVVTDMPSMSPTCRQKSPTSSALSRRQSVRSRRQAADMPLRSRQYATQYAVDMPPTSRFKPPTIRQKPSTSRRHAAQKPPTCRQYAADMPLSKSPTRRSKGEDNFDYHLPLLILMFINSFGRKVALMATLSVNGKHLFKQPIAMLVRGHFNIFALRLVVRIKMLRNVQVAIAGTGISKHEAAKLRDECLTFLLGTLKDSSSTLVVPELCLLEIYGWGNFSREEGDSEGCDMQCDNLFGIHPFYIEKGNDDVEVGGYEFLAPTTRRNVLRVLRAMELVKPVLLEGSPGVGKTSLIIALGRFSGHKVVRINLSEQIDMMDLLGSDFPVESEQGMQFAWSDGILLQAIKEGAWVLLDELNLAPQSVLEYWCSGRL
ncbi:hypothetical protein Dimus_037017 [Dionaea muscipula]